MAHYKSFEELDVFKEAVWKLIQETPLKADNLIEQLSKFINYLKHSDRKGAKFDNNPNK